MVISATGFPHKAGKLQVIQYLVKIIGTCQLDIFGDLNLGHVAKVVTPLDPVASKPFINLESVFARHDISYRSFGTRQGVPLYALNCSANTPRLSSIMEFWMPVIQNLCLEHAAKSSVHHPWQQPQHPQKQKKPVWQRFSPWMIILSSLVPSLSDGLFLVIMLTLGQSMRMDLFHGSIDNGTSAPLAP